ncbi:uncharacterized protein A4U43_C07F37190 [Asparagus officinalis]|uniref:non-specific serine/threonine protein kinase n=1 Tax=Asparagus officinalis TaxID=4686 RepID=A0A5P1EHN6_ASPOF|nr:probable serine/threonine-protein kinase WNK9 [Asparagus officinalis]ONK65445.1 uncharacterized protein A4U43_C07F37190 [Asparagus officinalis]
MNQVADYSEFVEVDPTGRYYRYNEILGKGSSKIVYRAFDEYEGIEVAWNQVKLYDFLQSQDELERLYCEIHLLKTLKHKNIMKSYTSWVDASKRNINFVTEMFTSGTLRQYRQKHRRVNIRAVKHWCRQILKGLLYLHSHDPPIIHRDLKCDNIFINGNQGEVKIGDLGLAAILRNSHAAHCVGTPEFMAPEVYEEEYNELVDIYSFGMCVLEMVMFEYPYSECTHPVQIYKKVISGTKPDALYRIENPELRRFVEKCLATVSRRLSARELLEDPFLCIDDHASVSSDEFVNGYFNDVHPQADIVNDWDYDFTNGMDLFDNHEEDEQSPDLDITIKGKRKEDGGIFLRLRIADKDGRVRNIYFPFDLDTDTALSVAAEMVTELDMTDYEVTRISEMIDNEVSSLVPEWAKTGRFSPPTGLCERCASNVSSCGSFLDFLCKAQGLHNIQSVCCSNLECAAMHGRFEEITYQVEGLQKQYSMGGAPVLSTSRSDEPDVSDEDSEGETKERGRDSRIHNIGEDSEGESEERGQDGQIHNVDVLEGGEVYDSEVRQEPRWIEAKYQTELKEGTNRRSGGLRRILHSSPDLQRDCRLESRIQDYPSSYAQFQVFDEKLMEKSGFNAERSPALFTVKNFYKTGSLLSNCLARNSMSVISCGKKSI